MDLATGTILASRYRALKVVGCGATGTVYRAQDLLLGGTVALKVLHDEVAARPERVRRIRRLVRRARRVSHPNVCRIHEYVEDGPARFVTMELVEGSDLERLLRQRGPLAPDLAVDVALQVAEGLAAIHASGIAHRGLTLRNVLRDERGRVKVTGFRSARRLEARAAPAVPAAGASEYVSPEQARGDRVDHRSDVYGLGILLFEMLTGSPPFRGATPSVTLFQHMYDPPPLGGEAARRVPLPVFPILEKALAKKREDRYQSAAEMAAALRAVRESGEVAALEPGALPWPLAGDTADAPSPRPGKRFRRPLVLAGAAALLATAAGTWLATGTRPLAPPPPSGLVSGQSDAEEPRPSDERATPSPETTSLADAASTAKPRPEAPDRPSADPPGTSPQRKDQTRTQLTAPGASHPAPAPGGSVPAGPALERVDVADPPIVPAILEPAVETAPREEAAGSAENPGRLQIGVRPWAMITIDGRPVGETPIAPLSLAPGVYTARLEHPEYRPLLRKVTVRPGETVRLKVDFGLDGIPR